MSQINPDARVAMLVPESTRTNYVTEVRRAAVARGISVESARAEKVKQWRTQHDNDPQGGWNVLADWLEKADLGTSSDISADDAAKVRALESAKRDPANPLNGILDLSDREVRTEVDASLAAAADKATGMAPVTTDDGEEIPASRVDEVLAGGKPDTGKATTVPVKKPTN